jgi:hypothetical protein
MEKRSKTMKISITRALVQLKTLDKKIKKKIENTVFIDYYQKEKPCDRSKKSVQDFEGYIKAAMDSIKTLIENRKKTKSAILLSNAQTMVEIGNIKYTVVEAIERKNNIAYEKSLLDSMKEDYEHAIQTTEMNRQKVEEKIERMLVTAYGADKRQNIKPEESKAISDPIRETDELKLADPLDLKTYIEKLEEDIMAFEGEVDFVLSESNARTEIEVEI